MAEVAVVIIGIDDGLGEAAGGSGSVGNTGNLSRGIGAVEAVAVALLQPLCSAVRQNGFLQPSIGIVSIGVRIIALADGGYPVILVVSIRNSPEAPIDESLTVERAKGPLQSNEQAEVYGK